MVNLNFGGQGDRIYSPDGKSVGLSALGGGGGAKTGLYAVTKNYGKWKERADGKSTCLDARYASFPDNHGARTGIYSVAQRGRNIVNGKRKDILGAKNRTEN